MKLTKEQIQFIEDYLIDQGVKYWDVRIELIDHLATKLEESPKLKLTRTFMILEFGSSISLNKIIDKKRESLNKKYQKLQIKEIKNIFKSLKKSMCFVGMVGVLIYMFLKVDIEYLERLSIVFVMIPVVAMLYIASKKIFNKTKTLHVESSAQIIMALSLMIQVFVQIDNLRENLFLKIFFFLLLVVYYTLFYSGAIVYKKTEKEFKEIRKQYQSL